MNLACTASVSSHTPPDSVKLACKQKGEGIFAMANIVHKRKYRPFVVGAFISHACVLCDGREIH